MAGGLIHPPRRVPATRVLNGSRSSTRIVHSDIDVKRWLERGLDELTVEVLRPPCCVGCGRASRVVGEGLCIHGHGVRPRSQLGPQGAGQAAEEVWLDCRRYRCCMCSAVMLVVPSDVLPRLRCSVSAIALAAMLWASGEHSAGSVRARVSPYGTDEAGWPSLGRWLRLVVDGRLFSSLRLAAGPPRRLVGRGELRAELCRLSKQAWRPPGAKRSRTYTVPTLERWYYAYRRGGARRARPEAPERPRPSPG